MREENSSLLVKMGDVSCILKEESGRLVPVGEGTKMGRLYLLNGTAQLLGQERTNHAAATQKLAGDT